MILNPEFSSQVQWRFINRAIDEVENDRVPALVLVCRNSTDTSYFQVRELWRNSQLQSQFYSYMYRN